MVWSNQYSKKAANNILPKSEWFDFIWPKRALVSAGGSTWTLQFGRDRLEIGNSTLGIGVIACTVGQGSIVGDVAVDGVVAADGVIGRGGAGEDIAALLQT